MNKKLLVAAVGAAMMTVGVAQADVKIGGVMHMSLDNLDRDNAADSGEWFVSNNSSFFYIHADESVGGGMKAIMGAEVQTSFDTASPGFANRNMFVGLTGGFGTVRLGNIAQGDK